MESGTGRSSVFRTGTVLKNGYRVWWMGWELLVNGQGFKDF